MCNTSKDIIRFQWRFCLNEAEIVIIFFLLSEQLGQIIEKNGSLSTLCDIASDTSVIASIHKVPTSRYCYTIYRPPDCPQQKFIDMLNITSGESWKLNSPMPSIVITGDFDFPIINWHTNVIQGARSECQRQARTSSIFLKPFVSNNLSVRPHGAIMR